MNDKIRTTWELIDAFTAPLGGIADSVGGFLQRAGGFMSELATQFKEGFQEGVDEGRKFRDDAAKSTTETGRLRDAVGQLGEKLTGLGEKLKTAFVNNVVSGAMGMISDAIGKVKGAMIDGNAEFERYQVQFGVLLKDSGAAKKRLEELAQFGASTPFELPEVVRADKILQSFGLHAEDAKQKFGESGEGIRTIAGDVAAGTGSSFEEIAGYIGKFSSGSTGEAIARFQELGIVTRTELAQMGLEFSKSGELVSPLDQSTTVLLEVMKKKFGGMMDAQSSTFEGMMSNLNDWFGQAGRIIGQPLFEILKDKLGSLLQFLSSPEAQAGLASFAQAIAGGIGSLIDLLTPVVQWVGANVPIIAATIQDLAGGFQDAFSEGGIAGVVAQAADVIGRAFGMTGDSAYQMGNNVFDSVSGIIDGIGQFVAMAQANLPIVIATIQNFATQAGDIINAHVVPAFNAIVPVVEKVVGFIVANMPLVWSIVQPVLQAIGDIIGAVVVPAFALMFDMVAKVFGFINENWPLIEPVFTGVLEIIRNVVQNVVPVIRDYFINTFGAVKTFIETTINSILTIIRGVLKLLNGDTKGAMDDLQRGFREGFEGILKFLGEMPANFVKLGTGMIQGLYNGLMAKLKDVGAFFDKLGKDPVATIQEALNMHSPSRVMFDLGVNTVAGYAGGLESAASTVSRAMGNIGGLAPAYANQTIAPPTPPAVSVAPMFKVFIGDREFAGAVIDAGGDALYSDMARRY